MKTRGAGAGRDRHAAGSRGLGLFGGWHGGCSLAPNLWSFEGAKEKPTFRVGDTEVVYTAPADVDLASLDGSPVRVELEPSGTVTKITRTTTVRTAE